MSPKALLDGRCRLHSGLVVGSRAEMGKQRALENLK
jgi:hypothetical protein